MTITRRLTQLEQESARGASWRPMIVVAAAQLLLVFNVSALKVSIDDIADTLAVPSDTIKTALVAYSLVVAGFIMLGARLSQRYGAQHVLRLALAVLAVAMAAMALCRSASGLMLAQMLAGAASGALIPTLVVMIADHYRGRQQAQALGLLGGLQAIGIVPAFLMAGYLTTVIEWRLTYGLLALYAALGFLAMGKLRRIERRASVHIDAIGVLLVTASILLIGIGAVSLSKWGLWRAKPAAPLSLFGISPALMSMLCGILMLHGFLLWSRVCKASGRMPLIAPEVVGTARELSALASIFLIGTIGAGLTFLMPLYIEVVQGRSSLYTAIALVPFTLASFVAATAVVWLHGRVGARHIARCAFLVVAAGVALLGATVRNDWSDSAVVVSLILTGFGEGALATLLFKLLARTVPRDLAGDVGSVCGCTSSLGAGLGTALAGALLVTVMTSSVQRYIADNPLISDELRAQVDLDSIAFVSNDRLLRWLERASAKTDEVSEAVSIVTQARLDALKVSLFVLAAFAALAFFPAAGVADVTVREPATEG